MSKRQTLMIIGVWILVLPFLGFPGSWEKVLVCLTGIVIAGVAYRLKPEGDSKAKAAASAASSPYVESRSVPPAPSMPPESAMPPVTSPDNAPLA